MFLAVLIVSIIFSAVHISRLTSSSSDRMKEVQQTCQNARTMLRQTLDRSVYEFVQVKPSGHHDYRLLILEHDVMVDPSIIRLG